jgi:hypothetical protein
MKAGVTRTALCTGQVTKNMHRVSAQNEDSRFKQAAANFLLQRYRSVRQSPVQNGVLGLDKQLQLFRFLCTNMAALSFFQGGVSEIEKLPLVFSK